MGCTAAEEPTSTFRKTGGAFIDATTLSERARQVLDGKKGEELVVLDVRGLSSVTDYYVIATGSSPPHLRALAETLDMELKRDGVPCYRQSGAPDSGWVVLDYVDVVVHLFAPEQRRYYDIERLWADARPVKEQVNLPR